MLALESLAAVGKRSEADATLLACEGVGEAKSKGQNEKAFHGLAGTIGAVRPMLGLGAGSMTRDTRDYNPST